MTYNGIMKRQTSFLLVIMLLISLLLAACTVQDEGKSAIPVYSQFKPDGGKYEQARQKMATIEKQNFPDKELEIKAYTSAASLDEVERFYTNALRNWGYNGRNDQGGISILKWGKGENKIVAIYYSPALHGSSENVVLIEQVWK